MAKKKKPEETTKRVSNPNVMGLPTLGNAMSRGARRYQDFATAALTTGR